MDLFIVAMSRFKRQKFDQTIELCNQMLANNPDDQVFIFLDSIFIFKISSIFSYSHLNILWPFYFIV